MKKCSRCDKFKELDCFSNNKKGLFGKQSRCKMCNAQLAKIKRDENPGYAAKIQEKYRKNNPDKIKKYNKENWRINKEKLSAAKKEWNAKNPNYYTKYYWSNDDYRERKKECHRNWSLRNKHKALVATRLHCVRNPIKVRARNKLRRCVYEKKIEKPKICEICMKQSKRIEGHHEDYSKPLNVKWVCKSCHNDIHLKKGF